MIAQNKNHKHNKNYHHNNNNSKEKNDGKDKNDASRIKDRIDLAMQMLRADAKNQTL